MTHNYKISGMTCGHCVERVRKSLLNLKEITQAEVRLPSTATLTMERHVPLEVLQSAISTAGPYSITMDEPV